TFTNSGTFQSAGTIIFSPTSPVTLTFLGTSFASTGIVTIGGNADITVAGGSPTFSSLNIVNTSANGVTPLSNWTVTGELFVALGSFWNGGLGVVPTVFAGVLA